MILTCPNCSTRYTLQDSQLPAGGRTVRCAACKTTWHAERHEDPIELPLPAAAAVRPQDLHTIKPAKLPGQYRAMVEDKKRLKELTAQGIVWGAMAVAAIAFVAIGYFFRVDIVRAFPRVAGAYAMVNVPVNASNLEIGEYTGDAAFKNGRFVVSVNAKITNLVDRPTKVPPVKVKLYDATGQQFDTVIIPSGGLVVEPKATRTLTFDVKDPKNLTAGGSMQLGFDMEAMKQGSNPPLRHAAGHDDDKKDDGHGPAPASEGDDHETTGHGDQEPVTGLPASDHGAADHGAADQAVALAGPTSAPMPSIRTELPASDNEHHAPAKPAAHGH